MKKILSSVIALMTFMGAMDAQIVINEIMYNPPEGGQDSLEYIELYNTTNSAVDVSNWTLGGVEYTFPQGSVIDANGYQVLAVNSQALSDVYGVESIQWTSGALGNGGEAVSISDANETIIDEVIYDDAGDWTSEPDGNGASLSLCDPMQDNSMGMYWLPSTNATGVTVNGNALGGTPGMENGVECPMANVTVQVTSNVFTPNTVTINVGETVEWVCTQGNHNVNGTQTTFPENPESFGNAVSSNWTYSHTFNTAGTYEYQCDPHVGFGMVGTVIVIGETNDNTYPMVSIEEAAMIDATTGVAVYKDSLREVQGVVYGVNMRPNGLSFTIIDEGNIEHGMGVFSDADNLGYTVMEGDKISIKGTVSQFNGLTQMAPDEITVMSTGNTLFDPVVTTTLGEAEESKLIRIENVMIADAPSSGTGNFTITDGVNTYTMRIDGDTGLGDFEYPAMFHVIGIGGQYDNSEPYTEGYQFFPRSAADIIPVGDVVEPSPTMYPVMNIADVTTVNAEGVVDSADVTCTLEGIVYGVDLNGNTNLFTIIDENDAMAGIAVYNNQDSVVYEVMEGDKVRIKGEISQYNGLQQIYVADIEVLSQANALHESTVVASLGETEESSLVTLEGLTYVSEATAGGGVNYVFSDGTNEYTVRIDNDTDLNGYTFDAGVSYSITGLGGQFDNSSPYTEGYQLLPRYTADVQMATSTNNPALANDIQIAPNPVNDVLSIKTDLAIEKVIITNNLGQEIARYNGVNSVNVSNYVKGVYHLTFLVNGETWTTRFIKH